jgi:hypothetical protein
MGPADAFQTLGLLVLCMASPATNMSRHRDFIKTMTVSMQLGLGAARMITESTIACMIVGLIYRDCLSRPGKMLLAVQHICEKPNSGLYAQHQQKNRYPICMHAMI